MKPMALICLLLTGCEISAEPPIILPPSPAGSGFQTEPSTSLVPPRRAAVQPARDADKSSFPFDPNLGRDIERLSENISKKITADITAKFDPRIMAIEAQIGDLTKRISSLPDATVEPKPLPIPATAPVVFQSGYIYLITNKTCAVCPKAEKEVEGLTNPSFVIVPEEKAPETLKKWLASLPEFSFPISYWEVKPGDWRTLFGWPGVKEVLSIYNISKTAAAGNKSAGPSLTDSAAARVHYPIRGSWWTGCHSWRHLTQGEHAGKFDPGWLSTLSNAEVQSLHSDDHEGRVHWNHVVRPGYRQIQYRRAA